MTQPMTISGELPRGVLVDGVLHREFTLRLPTVRDNIEAIDEVGASNNLAVSAAILARQLVKLGTLETKNIDYDLVAGMHPEDFNVIDAKAAELEKKSRASLASMPTSSGSGSDCAAPA